jgi:DNA-directed RNA polymerase specialized sigma subunit
MAATAVAPKLSDSEKAKLKTGPIRDIKKYIDVFTTKFCSQYGISHWQEDVAAECHFHWWRAQQNHAEKMTSPQYEKRVIFNAALLWEQRYRSENHSDELDERFTTPANELPTFNVDLSGLNDVERLILELRYGFGRAEGTEFSLPQIARQLGHSESWVYTRHDRALRILKRRLQ